jgi:SYP7 family syntaxin
VGVESLQKKVKKGKNITRQLVETRNEMVKQLMDKIYAIPDGMGGNRRPFKVRRPRSAGAGAR